MDFVAVMEQAIALLRQRGRVTYRTLQIQFTLDDEQLAALKDELLYSQPQVRDDTGRGLIWTDDSGPVLAGTAAPIAPPALAPLTYTPPYLAEKILTSRSALEGERKQVTVLFADLKGSMELLADRDPEEARQLLDPVLERMMAAVHRYEGTVNQVMGDGIMALFGAPLATGLNLSHKLSFARSWGPLQRGDPPWHTSPREPVPMPRFGTARRARCQR